MNKVKYGFRLFIVFSFFFTQPNFVDLLKERKLQFNEVLADSKLNDDGTMEFDPMAHQNQNPTGPGYGQSISVGDAFPEIKVNALSMATTAARTHKVISVIALGIVMSAILVLCEDFTTDMLIAAGSGAIYLAAVVQHFIRYAGISYESFDLDLKKIREEGEENMQVVALRDYVKSLEALRDLTLQTAIIKGAATAGFLSAAAVALYQSYSLDAAALACYSKFIGGAKTAYLACKGKVQGKCRSACNTGGSALAALTFGAGLVAGEGCVGLCTEKGSAAACAPCTAVVEAAAIEHTASKNSTEAMSTGKPETPSQKVEKKTEVEEKSILSKVATACTNPLIVKEAKSITSYCKKTWYSPLNYDSVSCNPKKAKEDTKKEEGEGTEGNAAEAEADAPAEGAEGADAAEAPAEGGEAAEVSEGAGEVTGDTGGGDTAPDELKFDTDTGGATDEAAGAPDEVIELFHEEYKHHPANTDIKRLIKLSESNTEKHDFFSYLKMALDLIIKDSKAFDMMSSATNFDMSSSFSWWNHIGKGLSSTGNKNKKHEQSRGSDALAEKTTDVLAISGFLAAMSPGVAKQVATQVWDTADQADHAMATSWGRVGFWSFAATLTGVGTAIDAFIVWEVENRRKIVQDMLDSLQQEDATNAPTDTTSVLLSDLGASEWKEVFPDELPTGVDQNAPCALGDGKGGCKSLKTGIFKGLSNANIPSDVGQSAVNTGALSDDISGDKSISKEGIGTAVQMSAARGDLKRRLKQMLGKANRIRRKSGKGPLDLDGMQARLMNQLNNQLKKNFGSGIKADELADYNEKVDKVAPTGVAAAAKKGSKNKKKDDGAFSFDFFGSDDSGNDQDEEMDSIVKGDGYEIPTEQINKRKDDSIFNILTKRYMNTAYPIFFEEEEDGIKK